MSSLDELDEEWLRIEKTLADSISSLDISFTTTNKNNLTCVSNQVLLFLKI